MTGITSPARLRDLTDVVRPQRQKVVVAAIASRKLCGPLLAPLSSSLLYGVMVRLVWRPLSHPRRPPPSAYRACTGNATHRSHRTINEERASLSRWTFLLSSAYALANANLRRRRSDHDNDSYSRTSSSSDKWFRRSDRLKTMIVAKGH